MGHLQCNPRMAEQRNVSMPRFCSLNVWRSPHFRMLTISRYGSVIGYNLYWIVIILGFVLLRWKEKKGRLPFQKSKDLEASAVPRKESDSDEASSEGDSAEKKVAGRKGTKVREVSD